MKKLHRRIAFSLFLLLLIATPLYACGAAAQHPSSSAPQGSADAASPGTGTRDATPQVLVPEASGAQVLGNDRVRIDASNVSQGYVMVRYSGDNPKVMVQITRQGSATYTYALSTSGDFEVFPFSDGDGEYIVNVYENIQGTSYSQAFGATLTVALENEFLPYLYPNQYVNFTPESQAVAEGAALAAGASSDLDVVQRVYNYIIEHIAYDYDLAEDIPTGYLPHVDEVLARGKGICFDYAALSATMLRSQRIPTQLVVGYAGKAYHAWINVHIQGVGWVNKVIEFDGTAWVRMDPTFAASGSNAYVGDGTQYNAMYFY
nr:transglutaminase-like domain-containing protein [Maliibacterium massiliense]